MRKRVAAINLFYSLPDDLMYVIHKKIFSDCVLEELKNRPGFFNFINENLWENIQ